MPDFSTENNADLNSVQTFINKIMSGASNTFTNIPDTALSNNIPLLNAINTFTAVPVINGNTGYTLTLQRTTSTAGLDVGIGFNEQNTTPATIRYAAFLGGIATGGNTPGAEIGSIKFQAMVAGTLTTILYVDGSGAIRLGTNQRLRFSETGLTTNRTFTFPDATTTILGTDTTQTLTNKNIDADGTGNSITNIEDADIKAAAGIVTTKLADSTNFVLTNRTNTFGDFDQVFKDNRLLINNPADAFSYTIIAAAIAANRNLTLPLLTGNDTAVAEAHSQTLTNKTISGAANTISNIPDGALSANIPLENAANVFTAQQKISVDNGQQIIFYRPVNTGGFGAGFYYNFNNSSSAEVTYGNQYASIEDNTAGSHRGDFNVQLAVASALAIRFRVYTSGNGGLLFGNNQRIQIDETGLSAARIFTLPDATTKLMGENTLVVQNPITKRTGTYMPTTPTTASATNVGALDGILQQHVPTGPGTNTNTFDTTEGLLTNLKTTTTSPQNAGLVSPTGATGVGRRLFGMKAILRSSVDTVAGGVSRLYFGFTSATAIPTTDTPIANADSGIIVGFTSADTNYTIRHNDGTGAASSTAITGPIAKNTSFHTIEISWTASGNIIVTFDGTAQTISTDLPLTTADLKFHCVAQNATAAIRTHAMKGVWLEADK